MESRDCNVYVLWSVVPRDVCLMIRSYMSTPYDTWHAAQARLIWAMEYQAKLALHFLDEYTELCHRIPPGHRHSNFATRGVERYSKFLLSTHNDATRDPFCKMLQSKKMCHVFVFPHPLAPHCMHERSIL